ncbi:uncharacterized protein LOC109544430 isoform X1 [Dendroctonus ponderosae]|nr:uncharacterized protein LOC109544430 isoform X1 [Dendroctonus ponderosae]
MSWISFWGCFLLIITCNASGPGETRVRCYLCSTKDNEMACLYPESYNASLIQCDQSALDKTREIAKRIDASYDKIFEVDTHAMARHIELDCLKVVTKVGNKKFTFRGCQLAEQANLDICYKLKTKDTEFLKKEHCSRCNTDRCNSASDNKNEIIIFGTMIASLLFIRI